MCWSANRVGAFYAGPALEGTKCGEGGKHCIEGECRGAIQLKKFWLEKPLEFWLDIPYTRKKLKNW